VRLTFQADSDVDFKILRFSERDLLMRYHWGLGVGHLHAHQPGSTASRIPEEPDMQDETEELGENNVDIHTQDNNGDVYDSDDPELGLEDRHLEGWEDLEPEGSEGEDMDDIMMEEYFTGM
jgi:hypothetical protein